MDPPEKKLYIGMCTGYAVEHTFVFVVSLVKLSLVKGPAYGLQTTISLTTAFTIVNYKCRTFCDPNTSKAFNFHENVVKQDFLVLQFPVSPFLQSSLENEHQQR